MIYSVDDLLSCLQSCWGNETIFMRTPKGDSFAVNGFTVDDESGDVILLTEKMEG